MDYAPTLVVKDETGKKIVAVPICNGLRSYALFNTLSHVSLTSQSPSVMDYAPTIGSLSDLAKIPRRSPHL